MSAAMEPLLFEPHPAYGAVDPDDGQPFPYGYISKLGPMPLFELRTLLAYPPDEFARYAMALTAAPDMLAKGKALVDRDCRYEGGNIVIPCKSHGEALRIMLEFREALAKAEGRQP